MKKGSGLPSDAFQKDETGSILCKNKKIPKYTVQADIVTDKFDST